ncbi:hypothetical protein BC832DRAFT_480594 [Gaertneriomyces semiglobifer]|nr:hypothetical protein BC832DRAFT_480594 [Gaertneriomyces semiglobifer]
MRRTIPREPPHLAALMMRPRSKSISSVCSILYEAWISWSKTRADFLKDPIGKIDFTILDGPASLWAHVVSVIEVSDDLSDSTKYRRALGQLLSRFQEVFRQQPDREFVLGAVVGPEHVEVVWQNKSYHKKRSGLIGLSFFAQNDGTRLLLGLLKSQKHRLGYISPFTSTPWTLKTPVGIFTGLGILRRSPAGRGSTVLSGTLTTEEAILKIVPAGDEWGDREAEVLQFLADVEHIPKLRCAGDFDGDQRFIITTPVGRHLEANVGLSLCAQAFADAASALDKAIGKDVFIGTSVSTIWWSTTAEVSSLIGT